MSLFINLLIEFLKYKIKWQNVYESDKLDIETIGNVSIVSIRKKLKLLLGKAILHFIIHHLFY